MENSSSGPVEKKIINSKFSQNILKSVVGVERAKNAFNSISLAAIPISGIKNVLSLGGKSISSYTFRILEGLIF